MTRSSTVPQAAAPELHPAVMALAHATRRDIIQALANGMQTPGEVADHLDKPLGVVSYHFRMLAGYGLIEVERVEPRRGALQHFYRFTRDAPDLLAEAREVARAASVDVERAGS